MDNYSRTVRRAGNVTTDALDAAFQLLGNTDGDNDVDYDDYTAWQQSSMAADVNEDGVIDYADFDYIYGNQGISLSLYL